MPTVIGIVDNDVAILGSIDAMLQVSGYGTELFSSGEALLDVVATSAATCFVIDIHLSGISGIEAARRLAAQGSSVPIIFVSGQFDVETESWRPKSAVSRYYANRSQLLGYSKLSIASFTAGTGIGKRPCARSGVPIAKKCACRSLPPCQLLMLWTAPPPARERHGSGRC